MKRASELTFLKWFYSHADFGPAEGDVRVGLKLDFVEQTGTLLPKGYEIDPDEVVENDIEDEE